MALCGMIASYYLWDDRLPVLLMESGTLFYINT